VRQRLHQAHDGQLVGRTQRLAARGAHLLPGKANEARVGQQFAQGLDQRPTQQVAGRFARHQRDVERPAHG